MKHNPGFLELVAAVAKTVRECTPADVVAKRGRGEAFHFLDVREDHEWSVDHAEGATHLGRGIIERDIETLIPDKDAEIVLYCGGGYRSALAADSLQRIGYRRVLSMAGGIRAWRAAQLAVVTGQENG